MSRGPIPLSAAHHKKWVEDLQSLAVINPARAVGIVTRWAEKIGIHEDFSVLSIKDLIASGADIHARAIKDPNVRGQWVCDEVDRIYDRLVAVREVLEEGGECGVSSALDIAIWKALQALSGRKKLQS